MSGEVVYLDDGKREIVEALEEMLQKAKSGEIKAFAVAYLNKEYKGCHDMGGKIPMVCDLFSMIGALQSVSDMISDVARQTLRNSKPQGPSVA